MDLTQRRKGAKGEEEWKQSFPSKCIPKCNLGTRESIAVKVDAECASASRLNSVKLTLSGHNGQDCRILFVNLELKPQVLKWARTRARLDAAALAKKVLGKKGKGETVEEWEETGDIKYRHAELLAEKTYTPFGYLFLDAPPEERLPIKDFRTITGVPHDTPSPSLLDVVYECQRRQAWYREHLIADGALPIAFVGVGSMAIPVARTASDIRRTFKFGGQVSAEIASWRENLAFHFEATEEAGVLVMRNGVVGNNGYRKLSVNEFRGFALSDKYAPLVFINNNDARAAQLFTLVHEIAHIWVGESALSNTDRTYADGVALEQYCNQVAAEVLVPQDDFGSRWNRNADPLAEIRRLAGKYKVSTLVAARRARDLNFVSVQDFAGFYEQELSRYVLIDRPLNAADKKSGNFHNTLRSRAGARFCNALIGSTLSGKTPYRQAFDLLGVRNTKSFESFARAKFRHLIE